MFFLIDIKEIIQIRASKFNILIDSKNKEEYGLYNTFTGAVILIDGEMKEILEGSKITEIPENFVTSLKKMGFIVPKNIDEIKRFKYRYFEKNYNKRESVFSIIPTYACNLRCPYCYEGSGEIVSKSMDSEMIERVLKGIKSYVLKNNIRKLGITLYGGEPLVVKKTSLKILKDLFNWCKENKINFDSSMITNGTLVTKELVNDFSKYLKMVQLTLDGPKKFHNSRRISKKGKGTYETILQAVKFWREQQVLVSLRIQISNDNYSEMSTLFEDLASRGIHTDPGIITYVFPLMELNNICASMASMYVKDEDELKIVPYVWKQAINYGFNSVVTIPQPTFVAPYCSFTNVNHFLVDGYGDLYKCVSVVSEKEFVVGKINENGNLSDFTQEFYNFQTRDPTEIPECYECKYLPICSGGCANRARVMKGSYLSPDCVLHKGLKDEQIRLFLKTKYPNKF